MDSIPGDLRSGLAGRDALVAGSIGLVGGTLFLARSIYRSVVHRRHGRLRRVFDRVLDLCRDLAD